VKNYTAEADTMVHNHSTGNRLDLEKKQFPLATAMNHHNTKGYQTI